MYFLPHLNRVFCWQQQAFLCYSCGCSLGFMRYASLGTQNTPLVPVQNFVFITYVSFSFTLTQHNFLLKHYLCPCAVSHMFHYMPLCSVMSIHWNQLAKERCLCSNIGCIGPPDNLVCTHETFVDLITLCMPTLEAEHLKRILYNWEQNGLSN